VHDALIINEKFLINIPHLLGARIALLVQRWVASWTVRVRFPLGANFFSSPQYPDRLWGPSRWYWGVFHRG
jgi:hypothetical protein